jgi:hypothetical protein
MSPRVRVELRFQKLFPAGLAPRRPLQEDWGPFLEEIGAQISEDISVLLSWFLSYRCSSDQQRTSSSSGKECLSPSPAEEILISWVWRSASGRGEIHCEVYGDRAEFKVYRQRHLGVRLTDRTIEPLNSPIPQDGFDQSVDSF